jgi:rod shape-determining protein MreD
MGPLLAAIGATIAALLEVTVASRYQVVDAHFQVILIFAVIITLVIGFEPGMTWAFVGGLLVDLLSLRPLGSTTFIMLAVVGICAAATPLVARVRLPASIAAVFLLTPLFLILSDITTALLKPPAPGLNLGHLVSAAVINALLAALIAPIFVLAKRRAEERERFLW